MGLLIGENHVDNITLSAPYLQCDWCRALNGEDGTLEDSEEVDLTGNNRRRSFGGQTIKQRAIKERPKSAIPELPGSCSWKKYSMHVDVDAWAPGVRVPDCTHPEIICSRVVCSKHSFKLRSQEHPPEETNTPSQGIDERQNRAVQKRPWSAFARIAHVKSTRQPRDQGLTCTESLKQKQMAGVPDKTSMRRPASAKARLQQGSCSLVDVAARPHPAGFIVSPLRQPRTLSLHTGRLSGKQRMSRPHIEDRSYVSTRRTRRPSCGVQCGTHRVSSHRRR